MKFPVDSSDHILYKNLAPKKSLKRYIKTLNLKILQKISLFWFTSRRRLVVGAWRRTRHPNVKN